MTTRQRRSEAKAVSQGVDTIRKSKAVATVRKPVLPPPRAVYALKAYTVEKTDAGWMIWPTVYHGEKEHRSGPFKTVEAASKEIAHKLALEIKKRHGAITAFYGVEE